MELLSQHKCQCLACRWRVAERGSKELFAGVVGGCTITTGTVAWALFRTGGNNLMAGTTLIAAGAIASLTAKFAL